MCYSIETNSPDLSLLINTPSRATANWLVPITQVIEAWHFSLEWVKPPYMYITCKLLSIVKSLWTCGSAYIRNKVGPKWQITSWIEITSTVDLVNLPCPKFGNLAFFRICQILIYWSWSYVIVKLKTEVSCSHIDTNTVPPRGHFPFHLDLKYVEWLSDKWG